MREKILFLTGTLAEKSLEQVLRDMEPVAFDWEVRSLGIKVAALMTEKIIMNRLGDTGQAQRVLLPGRCRGDLEMLSRHFGIPFERGPNELMDLPRHFGKQGKPPDLSHHDVTIFAEIVDAALWSPEQILQRARQYAEDGANVIDLGCLPDTPFPHLEESIQALKSEGFKVSVDSMQEEELLRGGRAGADFLLSLHEKSLWIADEVPSIPVLIPSRPGDLDSLERAMETVERNGRSYIADPILDPIHFGFADSLARYHALRKDHPDIEIMMGIGNLTELTEADTMGINAILMGVISELGIRNVLTTQVSPHCRSAIREADLARRIMYRAREDHSLPKQIHDGLTGLHEMNPFPYSSDQIRELAMQIKDPNYRIQVSREGVHLYNRDIFVTHTDPFEFFDSLEVSDDPGHAFYLGVELARAQIAWQLGKRHAQDRPLSWGCAAPEEEEDLTRHAEVGPTKRKDARKC